MSLSLQSIESGIFLKGISILLSGPQTQHSQPISPFEQLCGVWTPQLAVDLSKQAGPEIAEVTTTTTLFFTQYLKPPKLHASPGSNCYQIPVLLTTSLRPYLTCSRTDSDRQLGWRPTITITTRGPLPEANRYHCKISHDRRTILSQTEKVEVEIEAVAVAVAEEQMGLGGR